MSAFSTLLSTGLVCPTPSAVEGVSASVINTGWTVVDWSKVDRDARGGKVQLPFLVGVIEHPDGRVWVDAGLGSQTRAGRYPRLLPTGNLEVPVGGTAIEQTGGPPRLVLTTHLHYDHISGILDLPSDVTVWTTAEEWATARTSNAAFPERLMQKAATWHVEALVAGASAQVLGVPAKDVLGDGTVWYMSTPGHTPGSASVLVRGEDHVWLFVGDTAWVDSHLLSGNRPRHVSWLVDGRPRDLRRSLQWARNLRAACPDLNIVAGHEPAWVR